VANETLFEKFYNIAEEVEKAIKKPFVMKRVSRALDAAVDNYEERKMDAEGKIQDAQKAIANGDIEKIAVLVDLSGKLKEYDRVIAELKEQKVKFFG
jgi:hypothetical protein